MINESHHFDFHSLSPGSRTLDKSPTGALIDAVLADRPTDFVDVAGSRGGVGPPGRAKMISGFGAIVATTAGKIALCTAVAAASVGGVYASTDRINGPGAGDGPIVVDVSDSADGDDGTDARSDADGTVTEHPSDAANGHGREVAALATGTELGGCERGQEISELASANASEHRPDPERGNEACARSEDSDSIAAESDTEPDEQHGVDGSEMAEAASAGAQGVGNRGMANTAGKPDRSGNDH